MVDSNFVYVVTRDKRRTSWNNYETYEEALVEAQWWTALIHKVINGRKVDPTSIIKIVKTDTPRKIK
jgi:hypothetical protein